MQAPVVILMISFFIVVLYAIVKLDVKMEELSEELTYKEGDEPDDIVKKDTKFVYDKDMWLVLLEEYINQEDCSSKGICLLKLIPNNKEFVNIKIGNGIDKWKDIHHMKIAASSLLREADGSFLLDVSEHGFYKFYANYKEDKEYGF